LFEHIDENYARLRAQIAEAAVAAGRDPTSVRLMAVTKTQSVAAINHVLALGVDLIGENRVQEWLEKRDALQLDGVEVHLIGHLQSNKVRLIVPGVQCIQSVDSVRIAQEISRRAANAGIVQDVLCEVNIGQEESKFGFTLSSLEEGLADIARLPHLRVQGLMTVAPYTGNAAENRANFDALHTLYQKFRAQERDNIQMRVLSMGMSDDFREAIAAGSTLVRVGSALFGQRSVR
jgi:pyridoxal phosphate enzyme (YggS family)